MACVASDAGRRVEPPQTDRRAVICRESRRGTDRELAADVTAGLCDSLLLDVQHALLSAYAYALLDGGHDTALDIVRALLEQRKSSALTAAY